jgi:hypothetical protein
VQLAILKLADGNMEKLKSLLKRAKRDFRNVLGPAEGPITQYVPWLMKHTE